MRALLAVPLALLAAGCGSDGTAPVSGRVTLDGKPLAGAHVGFQPTAAAGNKEPGGGSYGVTDEEGRFTLRTVDGDRAGAVVGNHRVEIVVRDAADDDSDRRGKGKMKVTLPAKYNRNSELTFVVPAGGTDKADFALTSK